MFLLFSCKSETKISALEAGNYSATLKVNDSLDLPFNFEVISENKLQIFNADEVIEVNTIKYNNDSVYINIPVFESFIVAKIEKDKLNGSYKTLGLNRIMGFEAKKGDSIINLKITSDYDVTGNWETVFSPNSKKGKYIAKGIFKQKGSKVTGTFRTKTGDYRFLEGTLIDDQLKLSTFDGAHAFLFTATVTDSTMLGRFYSGSHWSEPFIANRNETFELPDPKELTYLQEGYDKIEFSFPDENDNIVSLTDDRFKNKVVIVQIMGTWCVNSLDETKYFASLYKTQKNEGLEIVALAFEYVKAQDAAFKNIQGLKETIGIQYPILLAQYGSRSKVKAHEKFPMLNHVLSYPTAIIIDKKGIVRRIYTGFNGPGTGEVFIDFKDELEEFVGDLLKE